jgi:hypothetical protein
MHFVEQGTMTGKTRPAIHLGHGYAGDHKKYHRQIIILLDRFPARPPTQRKAANPQAVAPGAHKTTAQAQRSYPPEVKVVVVSAAPPLVAVVIGRVVAWTCSHREMLM